MRLEASWTSTCFLSDVNSIVVGQSKESCTGEWNSPLPMTPEHSTFIALATTTKPGSRAHLSTASCGKMKSGGFNRSTTSSGTHRWHFVNRYVLITALIEVVDSWED